MRCLKMESRLPYLTHVSGKAFESSKRSKTMNHSSPTLSPNFVFPYRWAGTSPVRKMKIERQITAISCSINRNWTHDLCDVNQVPYQLSYQLALSINLLYCDGLVPLHITNLDFERVLITLKEAPSHFCIKREGNSRQKSCVWRIHQ